MNIAPDIWMRQATGAPVGADALLVATERALHEMQGERARGGARGAGR